MAKNKRWGDTYIDRRIWSMYNEQLVKRGEYLIDIDFVEHWDKELSLMNRSKRGAPYRFPHSLIELHAVWHAKKIPYRMIEGMTRRLASLGGVPAYDDYSTSNRRVNRLPCKLLLPIDNSDD